MKYKVSFPVTEQMSPISYTVGETPMETKEEQALWHYNHSRAHDYLKPLTKLPQGTKFEPIYENH